MGCEAAHREQRMGIQWRKLVFGFIPIRYSRKGFSPHIPAPRLFILLHPSQAISSTQKKEHSLLVLPSVHTIINFATKFFEMFTKLQSEHPHKVFQVFRVFQVFHVRFWTRKPPDFGPNPNKPGKSPVSPRRHIMATENTQKGNSPTCQRTRYSPVCHSRSCCSAEPTFILFHPTGYYKKNRHLFF